MQKNHFLLLKKFKKYQKKPQVPCLLLTVGVQPEAAPVGYSPPGFSPTGNQEAVHRGHRVPGERDGQRAAFKKKNNFRN